MLSQPPTSPTWETPNASGNSKFRVLVGRKNRMERGLYIMGVASRPYDTSEPRLSMDEWGEVSQGWGCSGGRIGEPRKTAGTNLT